MGFLKSFLGKAIAGIGNVFGSEMIFDDFVFHNAHTGLRNRGLGKGDTRLVCRGGSGKEDPVHLFLGKVGVKLLGLFHTDNFRFQRFNGIDDRILSTQIQSAPSLRLTTV